jgi:hypothetical protein
MRWLWVGLLLVTACGSLPTHPADAHLPGPSPSATAADTPASTSSPSPSADPSSQPSTPLLFAALEAKGATSASEWNTVVIAGLDGQARAKTTFIPMPRPYVGCTDPVLPPSAHVAAAHVYFADGSGTVRSLAADGTITQVATFPLTSTQQLFSFAVSPDGARLLATVFTLPPKPSSGDTCTGWMLVPGDYSLDVYSAQPGEAGRLLYHQSLHQTTTDPVTVMELAGWDEAGPIGTFPSFWAGSVPVTRYTGTPVRVDAYTGEVLNPVSDALCGVSDIASTGDFVCSPVGAGDVSVRRQDGHELWRFRSPAPDIYYYGLLAPDERHVVALDSSLPYPDSRVLGLDGSTFRLPDRFLSSGWLDANTVIGFGPENVVGITPDRNLGYITLSAPNMVVNLGFQGLFVGMFRT